MYPFHAQPHCTIAPMLSAVRGFEGLDAEDKLVVHSYDWQELLDVDPLKTTVGELGEMCLQEPGGMVRIVLSVVPENAPSKMRRTVLAYLRDFYFHESVFFGFCLHLARLTLHPPHSKQRL